MRNSARASAWRPSEILIAALQMRAREVFSGHHRGSQVLRVLRNQPGGLLKLVESFVELPGMLKLEAPVKCVVGSLAVFGGIRQRCWTSRRASQRVSCFGTGPVVRTRSLVSRPAFGRQKHEGQRQKEPIPEPSHTYTIECPDAGVLQGKYSEGNYDRNGLTPQSAACRRSPGRNWRPQFKRKNG